MRYYRFRNEHYEDPRMLPTDESIEYHLSMLNPNHKKLRELEDHLDSIMPDNVMDFDENDEY